MTTAHLLYDLQVVDTDLGQKRTQLASLEARLGDETPLSAVRARLDEAQHRLADLRAQQRDQELAADSIRERIRNIEQRLYGGRVTNPRELNDLEHEAAQLKEQAGQGEERALGLMDEMETAQDEVRRATEALAQAEARWRQEQETARQQVAALQAAVASLEARRREAVARVPPDAQVLYDRLRAARGGTAVVGVERGMCQGCRVTLPTVELQRARTSPVPVFCSTCGRVLYVS